jgi:hypothetical protein
LDLTGDVPSTVGDLVTYDQFNVGGETQTGNPVFGNVTNPQNTIVQFESSQDKVLETISADQFGPDRIDSLLDGKINLFDACWLIPSAPVSKRPFLTPIFLAYCQVAQTFKYSAPGGGAFFSGVFLGPGFNFPIAHSVRCKRQPAIAEQSRFMSTRAP